MTVRQIIALVFSVLAVVAGVAHGMGLTEWHQLTRMTLWMDVILVIGGSSGIFGVGKSLPNAAQKKEGVGL